MNQLRPSCPACGTTMTIRRYQCPRCDTAVEGQFAACGFCRLSPEQLNLIRTFLAARGNLKEVERALGISYPTVRARLDGVNETLGIATSQEESDPGRSDLLEQLERGELSVEEALARLKQ